MSSKNTTRSLICLIHPRLDTKDFSSKIVFLFHLALMNHHVWKNKFHISARNLSFTYQPIRPYTHTIINHTPFQTPIKATRTVIKTFTTTIIKSSKQHHNPPHPAPCTSSQPATPQPPKHSSAPSNPGNPPQNPAPLQSAPSPPPTAKAGTFTTAAAAFGTLHSVLVTRLRRCGRLIIGSRQGRGGRRRGRL